MRSMLTLAAISAALFSGCYPTESSDDVRQRRIHHSPQFKAGKFANPIEAPIMAPGTMWTLIKKFTVIPRIDPRPAGALPVVPLRPEVWPPPHESGLGFTWLGHSSIFISLDGITILIDPVLEDRASPFSWAGPKRFDPSPASADMLFAIDVVLITHDHYDHLEAPTIKSLAGIAKHFIVPLGIGTLLEKWGVDSGRIAELDWWEHYDLCPLRFTATPAVHYAGRGVLDRNRRLWCSWSISGAKKKVFVSGDSGYFTGFEDIGERLGPCDVTFLKIGAYDETWPFIHMTPEEAVLQHLALGGHYLVPVHWATFDLGLHPWYEPIERLLVAAKARDVQVLTPEMGRWVDIRQMPETAHWWRGVDSP